MLIDVVARQHHGAALAARHLEPTADRRGCHGPPVAVANPASGVGQETALVAERDDLVADTDRLAVNVSAPAGNEPTGHQMLTSEVRQRRGVVASLGEHHHSPALVEKVRPSLDHRVEGRLAVTAVNTPLGVVRVAHRLDAVAELQRGGAFPVVAEPPHPRQFRRSCVLGEESEQPARVDRSELAVVPNRDDLGGRRLGEPGQLCELVRRHHRRLIHDQHLAPGDPEVGSNIGPAVLPQQLCDRLSLHSEFGCQHVGRNRRHREAAHRESSGPPHVSCHRDGGRLAGSGRADQTRQRDTIGRDPLDRGPLIV